MGIWGEFVSLFASGLQGLSGMFAFLGAQRWAAAIVMLTLIVRTLLLPLAIKQIRSMQAMQRLQPEMKRLQQKYRSDRQRLNQELMELYKREGVNPLGGCLPLVAQAPVLFAMFYAIRDLAAAPHVEGMPFLGLGDLADNAGTHPGGWLLLALMTATSFLSMRQLSTAQNPQQKRLMQLMPLFFVFIMINFPAGLVLYWATQNVYQYAQQTIMLRRKPALPAASPQPAAPPRGGGKGPAKSRPEPKRPRTAEAPRQPRIKQPRTKRKH